LGMVLVLGVLVLELGSHDEELAEETAEATHAGEVIRIGAAGVTLRLVYGAEDGLAAMRGAGVCWGEETLRGGAGDGGGGLRARRAVAVAEIGVGVGAEEGEDED